MSAGQHCWLNIEENIVENCLLQNNEENWIVERNMGAGQIVD